MPKDIILTSGEQALGMGDAFMLAPTLLELSKNFEVRHIASQQSHKILKRLASENIKIYDLNEQGHFFTNDHVAAYNFHYYSVKNTLRNFGCHAINVIRQIADLPPYTDELPEIPIDLETERRVFRLMKTLKRPIVVTQPNVSFWNKMIDIHQQIEICDRLIQMGYTVIQIGNDVPEEYIHPLGINLINRNTLDHSMALIKYADLFVGTDSFGQHCAASMKTPSVVLWCGTSPTDFGYDFFSNIWYPHIVPCQLKCGRPMRWLYDYDYSNPDDWNSRTENGWVCPTKFCSKAISIDDVMQAVNKELEIGGNRDWKFRNYVYNQNSNSSPEL